MLTINEGGMSGSRVEEANCRAVVHVELNLRWGPVHHCLKGLLTCTALAVLIVTPREYLSRLHKCECVT